MKSLAPLYTHEDRPKVVSTLTHFLMLERRDGKGAAEAVLYLIRLRKVSSFWRREKRRE